MHVHIEVCIKVGSKKYPISLDVAGHLSHILHSVSVLIKSRLSAELHNYVSWKFYPKCYLKLELCYSDMTSVILYFRYCDVVQKHLLVISRFCCSYHSLD